MESLLVFSAFLTFFKRCVLVVSDKNLTVRLERTMVDTTVVGCSRDMNEVIRLP